MIKKLLYNSFKPINNGFIFNNKLYIGLSIFLLLFKSFFLQNN